MIQLNYRDPRPLYEQVRDSLRQMIVTGAIAPGERIPSVRELASSLAINPNTIQRAYRELEADGYLCTVPGKGSFACGGEIARRARRRELSAQLSALAAELRALGVTEEELLDILQGGEEP